MFVEVQVRYQGCTGLAHAAHHRTRAVGQTCQQREEKGGEGREVCVWERGGRRGRSVCVKGGGGGEEKGEREREGEREGGGGR